MGNSDQKAKSRATAVSTAVDPKRRQPRKGKPAKPYPEFPLYAHNGGVWAKQIRGREYYFGPWANPDGALAEYLRKRDFLYAGVAPPNDADGLTLDEMVNRFLAAQRDRCQVGEISHWHYADCRRDAKLLLDCLGRTTPVRMLRPEQFTTLRASLAQGVRRQRNATTIVGIMIRIRSMFGWAYETAKLLTEPVNYGGQFSLPSARARRLALASAGPRDVTAGQMRSVLKLCDGPGRLNLKAAILLGINCGFGNTDCSDLTLRDLLLESRPPVHAMARGKTGAARRAVLWPETVRVIGEVRKQLARRLGREPTPNDRLLRTRNGQPYVHASPAGKLVNNLTREFARVAKDAGLGDGQRAFYNLRRTFATVADELPDAAAIDLVMGHAIGLSDMPGRYRQRIGDDRLAAISEHVRKWLFGKQS